MDDVSHWGSIAFRAGLPSRHFAREASNEWSMAVANEVAAWESTATLDFHLSRIRAGMGYRKRGTLGGLANGGTVPPWTKSGDVGYLRPPDGPKKLFGP
jgi:hypothetical protein